MVFKLIVVVDRIRCVHAMRNTEATTAAAAFIGKESTQGMQCKYCLRECFSCVWYGDSPGRDSSYSDRGRNFNRGCEALLCFGLRRRNLGSSSHRGDADEFLVILCRLYVGNLDKRVTEGNVMKLFSQV